MGVCAILGRVGLRTELYSTSVTIMVVILVTQRPGTGVRPGMRGVGFPYNTINLVREPSGVRVLAPGLLP